VKFVLNNLREGDMFNIVAYDSVVESWKPELQKFDEPTRKAAAGFVDGIYAGGSTNIDGALSTALSQIKDTSRPNFVIFLTDGLPTHGETNEGKIAANVKTHNETKTRVVSFGVGYDVNSRLLDRISHDNFGQSEYVRPNENIEASVSKVYNKMSSPVLSDVKVAIDVEGASVEMATINRMYPKQVWDIFAGEQVVIAGRYKKAGAAKVVITGKVNGEEKKFDFPATLAEKSGDQSYAFVEKLWAIRRVGEIIDQLDLHGKNDEIVKELVELSTKHGILTPYTSFLADDQARASDLASATLSLGRTRENLLRLDEAEGRGGVAQRAEKKGFQYAENLDRFAKGAEAAATPADAKSGVGGGLGGFSAGSKPRSFNAPTYRDITSDKEVAADGLRQAGQGEALYKRGNKLIAANAKDVDVEKDDAKIKKIKRFSEEYFALVKANTANENALLAEQGEGEELYIKLRGEVYCVK